MYDTAKMTIETLDKPLTITLPSGVYDVQGQKFQGPGTVIVQGGKVIGGTALPEKRR